MAKTTSGKKKSAGASIPPGPRAAPVVTILTPSSGTVTPLFVADGTTDPLDEVAGYSVTVTDPNGADVVDLLLPSFFVPAGRDWAYFVHANMNSGTTYVLKVAALDAAGTELGADTKPISV